MLALALNEQGKEELAIPLIKETWLALKQDDLYKNWKYGIIDGFFF